MFMLSNGIMFTRRLLLKMAVVPQTTFGASGNKPMHWQTTLEFALPEAWYLLRGTSYHFRVLQQTLFFANYM